jgi:hypothetical protein
MRRAEIRLDKIMVHADRSSLNLESRGCIEPVYRPLRLRFEATTLSNTLEMLSQDRRRNGCLDSYAR